MKKVFIVIPTYNGLAQTKKCLATIPRLHAPQTCTQTLIIDNASEDGTATMLEKQKEKYRIQTIIANKKNLGFAKACNQGIRIALKNGADYILLLNSDMEIVENCLPSLLQANMDIISPVNQFPVTPDKDDYRYDYGGYINWWTGRVHHDDRSEFLQPTTYNLKPIIVDYDSGCSLLVKSRVFDKIGLLDEQFFMYFEDVDFCVRARKAGMTVAVDPKSRIFHKLGSSIKRWSKKAIYYNLTSNAMFIIKHCGIRIPVAFAYLSLLTSKIIFDKIKYKLSTKN